MLILEFALGHLCGFLMFGGRCLSAAVVDFKGIVGPPPRFWARLFSGFMWFSHARFAFSRVDLRVYFYHLCGFPMPGWNFLVVTWAFSSRTDFRGCSWRFTRFLMFGGGLSCVVP